jgi:2-oxoisovalerate dehydrogenase E2 component (dihydrolipoyl transacylase)
MTERVIKIPDIGEGIAEVELVAWHVKPGDTVVEDQALADVMTDKATVEVPSPVNGKVVALGGEVGQLMAVGSELIRIDAEGPPPRAAKSHAASGAMASSAASHATTSAAAAAPAQSPPPSVASTGSKGTIAPAGRAPAPHRPWAGTHSEKPIASPSVRRRAWELGIDLTKVPASGTAGRIMQSDLAAYAEKTGAVAQPAATGAAPAVRAGVQRDDEEKVPVIGLRRKIAQKMQESKRRIPHFTYVEEVDVTDFEALRARLNAKGQGPRLTVLPFLMRAVVTALRDFPQINAHFDDEAGVLTRFGAVHLGIATQTAAGLLVPVVRQAQALDLWGSAKELSRVAEAARSGKATRAELSGSTITITSLGALGGIVSTPIINHPEVAIVGVNRIVTRPMMNGSAIVPRQLMNLSSSFDHRVVDGQQAAEFVQAVRALLECPALLFVEGPAGG